MRPTFIWIVSLSASCLLGASTAAIADDSLPKLPNAELLETTELADGGTRQAFRTSTPVADLVDHYASDLRHDGWTITRQGADGGTTGGGGEVVADREGRHVVLQAGGPDTTTFVRICSWPKRPPNDYCE